MKTDNIDQDTEFYILEGKKTHKPLYRRVWFWLGLATLAIVILIIVQWGTGSLHEPHSVPEMYEYNENFLDSTDCVPQCAEVRDCIEKENKECLHTHTVPFNDTVCNNHLLRIYSITDQKSEKSKPQGRSTWQALCEKDGKILFIESDNTTFHDFAKALSDYGVTNAIYIVDGKSYGFYRPDDSKQNDEPNTSFFILK